MAARASARPIVSVMTNVASDMAYLVRTEFRLARAELGEKFSAMSSAGIYIGVGAAFALSGLIVVLFDIAHWIVVAGLAYPWALLIVGLVSLVLGLIAARTGVSRIRSSQLMPERTLEQMREDFAVAKEHVG